MNGNISEVPGVTGRLPASGFRGSGQGGARTCACRTPRPRTRIKCPQAVLSLRPTPPSTEVYSAHDHTARFQASDPLPLLSWARRWRAATQPVFLREGMRGTGDCGAICAGRPAAKGGGREGLASQRPHRRRRLRRPVPGPGRISLSTPAPRFRTSAPAAKARPPQTRLRPVELPGPKSFHPRSCSQAGVGANPAQA